MKDLYKIHEIARLFHLHPDTLRYYEEKGLLRDADLTLRHGAVPLQPFPALPRLLPGGPEGGQLFLQQRFLPVQQGQRLLQGHGPPAGYIINPRIIRKSTPRRQKMKDLYKIHGRSSRDSVSSTLRRSR